MQSRRDGPSGKNVGSAPYAVHGAVGIVFEDADMGIPTSPAFVTEYACDLLLPATLATLDPLFSA
jgi:hypothetical protein